MRRMGEKDAMSLFDQLPGESPSYGYRVRQAQDNYQQLCDVRRRVEELERQAEAWKRACELFNVLTTDATQLCKLEGQAAEIAAHRFAQEFEALKLIYGDPTKESPLGVINVDSRPKSV